MSTEVANLQHGRNLLLNRCKTRALALLKEKEYSRSFAHFLITLTVEPAVKGELLNAFLFTLDKLIEKLEENNQVNEILHCYEEALELMPQEAHVLHGLATTLFRFGFVECALTYFLKAYEANPFFTPSLYCMENLKNALVERWHFVMLNDRDRNLGFKRALQHAIEQGHKHVLDIGAGTGIFSMMAADAGAEKVFACEASEIMCAVLQNVIEANNKPVQLIEKMSIDVKIPEDIPQKVTLVVTEVFDAGLFGENCLYSLKHAWEYLLAEEGPIGVKGRVIPQSADVFVAPIESERFRKSIKLNDAVSGALGIPGVDPVCADDDPYSTERILDVPCRFLAPPAPLLHVDFSSLQAIQSLLDGQTFASSFTCAESGTLDAIVLWFDLHLDDQETISTSPRKATAGCCWEQAIYYVTPRHTRGTSTACETGDTIEVEFLCKGYLQLKSVRRPNQTPVEEPAQSVTMDHALVYLLNSYTSGNVGQLDLRDIASIDNPSVLDVSTFPYVALKTLRSIQSSEVYVLQTQYQSEVEAVRRLTGTEETRLTFKTYEDFCSNRMQCDFLVFDPVEVCGLLKKSVLEDITFLRVRCLKDSGVVVPGVLEMYGVLIESPALMEHSRMASDERVDGYDVAQFINIYQCFIHQDLQLSSLPHKKLTEPFRICSLDLNGASGPMTFFRDTHVTPSVSACAAGQAHAVAYWFRVGYHTSCVVDTSDDPWRQAACVFPDAVLVGKDSKVRFQFSLKNSCFQIGLVRD